MATFNRLHLLLRLAKLTSFVWLLGIFLLTPCFGQGEGNHWMFGQYAGVHFSDCAPTATGPHSMITSEGCTSISDPDGNLLFYSDGLTVWDKNDNVMVNGTGLLGNSSITQNGLVVKKPGNNPIYYLFTGGAGHYSEIDMSLNGGLGEVTVKNVPMNGVGSEKVTAINHANGVDVWLVRGGVAAISSFLITSAGVPSTPVNSNTISGYFGQMKISPDGNWLGLTRNGGAAIYTFDNSTGMAGTDYILSTGNPLEAYGLEFSPDGTKVYVSHTYYEEVYQFDLTLGTAAAMNANVTMVGQWPSYSSYAMQLAPDGKIYGVASAGSHLFVINEPNLPGLACNYTGVGLQLANGTGNYLGLPGFNQSIFFKPAFICIEMPCMGDTTTFKLPINNTDSVYWDFGDPSSGAANNSTQDQPWHIYSDTGSYLVKVLLYYPNAVDTLERQVYIHGKPTVDLGNDTLLCPGQSFSLDVSHVFSSGYTWSTGSDSSAITINTGAHYWVGLDYFCGVVSDSLLVQSIPDPTPTLGNDTALCPGDTLHINLPGTNIAYTWHNGSTDSTMTVLAGDTVWVQATNFCGQAGDTLATTALSAPQIQIVGDSLACYGDSLSVADTTGSTSFLWSDSSTTSFILPTASGWYTVSATQFCGTATDSFYLASYIDPNFNLGPDTLLCDLDTFWLQTGQQGTHVWQDGSNNNTFPVQVSGAYSVTVNTQCGTMTDTINIQKYANPVVNLGLDTTLCVNDSLVLNAQNNGSWYLWQDNSMDSTMVVYTENAYWVTTTNPCGTFSDTIQVDYDDSLFIDLGVDTVICQGDTLTLNTFLDPENPHLWQDSSALNSYAVWVGGNYWVMVRNVCGPVRDTIVIQFETKPTVQLGPDTNFCLTHGLPLEYNWPGSVYNWSTGDTSSSTLATTTGTYWLDVTNLCGTTRDSITLVGKPPPTVTLDPVIGGCKGSELIIQPVQSSGPLAWSTGDTAAFLSVKTPGTYWATVWNVCGMVGDTTTVILDQLPTISVTRDTFMCAGDEVQVTAHMQGNGILWSTGDSNASVTLDQPGIYWTAVWNYCDTTTDSIRVREIDLPVAELPSLVEICPGEQDTIYAKPSGVHYDWDDGSTAPYLIVKEPGFYSVQVTTGRGCMGSAEMEVQLCPSLWIPNAFTPNGDGKNDVFRVEGERFEEFDLRIFNRWGERIFQTNNPLEAWDGRFEGQLSQQGVYIWELHYIGPELRKKVRHGSVRLIR